MTAAGGIPPAAGRLLEQLIAAQRDAIAARLADVAAIAPVETPAPRARDRVEWSAVAELLAATPDGATTAGPEAGGDVARARAAALLAAVPAAAAHRPELAELLAERQAAAPAPEARLDPRVDMNALRLALPLPLQPASTRARAVDAATERPHARGTAGTGAAGDASAAPGGRSRLSRWRVALLVVGIGAAVYVLGATLGAPATIAALALAAGTYAAALLGLRLRRRARRRSTTQGTAARRARSVPGSEL